LDVEEVWVAFGAGSVQPGGQTTVTVSVRPALPGWPVALSVSEVPHSGGHQHVGRPPGQLGQVTGVTNAQGVFSTTYTASEFSGGEVVTATVFGAGAATTFMASATLEVGIGGLLLLPDGYGYLKTGSNDHHPGNHYGTPGTVSALMAIASAYAVQYPGSVLYYNDISLEQGGLFDIGPPYGALWQSPHAEHRFGTNADVSKGNVPAERHGWLEALFISKCGTPHHHSTHWHLRC
jgi:hypothetical protein